MPPTNPYLKEPQQDLIDELLSGGGSALRFIGGVLDTPGSIVRNTLALKNPLQGLFNLDNRTEGRDLLEQYGLLGENTPGFDMGDVTGFAADVVTDPLFYLGVGALNKGGKVLQSVGKVPGKVVDPATGALTMGGREARASTNFAQAIDPTLQAAQAGDPAATKLMAEAAEAAKMQGSTINDLLQDPEALARDIGVHVPFMGEVGSFNIPGSMPVRRFLDKTLHAGRVSAPGRAVASKFDYGSRGTKEAPTQFRAQDAQAELDQITPQLRKQAADDRLATHDVGLTAEEHNHVLRRVLEQTSPTALKPLDLDTATTVALGQHGKNFPQTHAAVKGTAQKMMAEEEEAFQSARSWGLVAARTDESVYGFSHRQPTDEKYLGGITNRALETKDPFGKRSPHGRVVPGGTDVINTIMSDQKLRGMVEVDVPGVGKVGVTQADQSVVKEASPGQISQLARPHKFRDPNVPIDNLTHPQAARMIKALERAEAEGAALNPLDPNYQDQLQALGGMMSRTQGLPTVQRNAVPTPARQYILEKYFHWMQPDFDRFADLQKMKRARAISDVEQAELDALKARYDSAGHYAIANKERPIAEFGKPFYGNDPVVDHLKYREATAQRVQYAEKLYDLFAATGKRDPVAYPPGHGPEGYMKIKDALKEMGIPQDVVAQSFAMRRLAPMLKKYGHIDQQTLDQMSHTGAIFDTLGDQALKEIAPGKFKEFDGLLALDQFYIPKKFVEDAGRLMTTARQPGLLEELFRPLDPLLNTTKAHFTGPFPGFHVRNWYNILWQMVVDGAHDPQYQWFNPKAYWQQWKDASALVKGEKIPNASRYFPGRNLSDDEAYRELQGLTMGQQTASGAATFHHEGVDIVGKSYQSYVPDLMQHIPGAVKQPDGGPLGLGHLWKGWKSLWTDPAARDPRKVRGGYGVKPDDTLFGPYSGGLRTASYLESTGRTAHSLGHMLQGRNPNVSMTMANVANVRYDRLTEFERQVMKRVIPFYTWVRGMLPYQLNNLIHNPGGLTAQAIKATNRTKERGGFTPDYLQGTLSAPLGSPDEEGNQTFLTGLDLPFEAMNDLVQFGNSPFETAQKTIRSLGGMLRPEIQAPIELATGKSLFQGRNLRELDPVLGRLSANIIGAEEPLFDTPLLDEIVMKSPAARYLSSAKVVTDNRDPVVEQLVKKPLHLGSGMRFKDVNIPQQMDFKILQELKEEVNGERPFRVGDYITVKKEDLPKLSERQRRLLELYKARSKKIRDAAKAKKDK